MPERLDQLEIPLEVSNNAARRDTAFCVSIDAHDGTSTGISAADRARDDAGGHRSGDAAARPGAARATCSRCARATAACSCAPGTPRPPSTWRGSRACNPAGVICEIMNDDGTMARVPGADEVRAQARPADDHDRRPHPVPHADREPGPARRDRRRCRPTTATFTVHAYESAIDGESHVALVRGDIGDGAARHGARALEVPDRRRVPFAPLRLRAAAATRR